MQISVNKGSSSVCLINLRCCFFKRAVETKTRLNKKKSGSLTYFARFWLYSECILTTYFESSRRQPERQQRHFSGILWLSCLLNVSMYTNILRIYCTFPVTLGWHKSPLNTSFNRRRINNQSLSKYDNIFVVVVRIFDLMCCDVLWCDVLVKNIMWKE